MEEKEAPILLFEEYTHPKALKPVQKKQWGQAESAGKSRQRVGGVVTW